MPFLSRLKPPQQIVGALIKTYVAEKLNVKTEKIFSVSSTPCSAMKFEARREGMMRKGISDVDSVLTVRELARLIRLYGVDISNQEEEPADAPMDFRSSSALLSEISGGITEAVLREAYFLKNSKEPDKQLFKKIRSGGAFREMSFSFGEKEFKVAVVDGLTGLEKLKSAMAAGTKYSLIEVMVCPGGCIHGAGMTFCRSREDLKGRAKVIYQTDDSEAISLAAKSPAILNFYDKIVRENKEIQSGSVFNTHFSKRDVLL
jgi:iron only hydrogenase large subunit-like protein